MIGTNCTREEYVCHAIVAASGDGGGANERRKKSALQSAASADFFPSVFLF